VSPAEDALALALARAGTDTGIIVAGSVFIAAAARDIWYSGLSQADKSGV